MTYSMRRARDGWQVWCSHDHYDSAIYLNGCVKYKKSRINRLVEKGLTRGEAKNIIKLIHHLESELNKAIFSRILPNEDIFRMCK